MSVLSDIQSRFINYASPDIFRKSFEAQTATTQNLLRQVLKSEFNKDSFGGIIFHAAIIISKPKIEKIDNNNGFFGFLKSSGVGETRSYKVMIPEVNAGIPSVDIVPEKEEIQKITDPIKQKELKELYVTSKSNEKNYTTVLEFNPEDPSNKTLKPGDAVWVMFQNSRTLENGFLIGKILNSGLVGAGILTSSDIELSKLSGVDSPLSPKLTVEKETNRNPPGFDGRYIVPYDAIVDLMGSSKGCPYRYHIFPAVYDPEATDESVGNWGLPPKDDGSRLTLSEVRSKITGFKSLTTSEYREMVSLRPSIVGVILPKGGSGGGLSWEYNQLGIQCQGFVYRALQWLNIVDLRRVITTPIPGAEELGTGTVQQIFIRAGNRKLHLLGKEVKLGEQLPGDYALHGKDCAANCGHMTLVVSYPDPNKGNHSITWGANAYWKPTGPWYSDADQWMSGVGTNPKEAAKEKSIADRSLFKPMYGIEHGSVKYYRIRNELLSDDLRKHIGSGWINQDGKSTPSFKNPNMAKESYWPRHYEPPKTFTEHPPAVVQSRDLFRERRIELMEKDGISPVLV
jgi:hypothetical protein